MSDLSTICEQFTGFFSSQTELYGPSPQLPAEAVAGRKPGDLRYGSWLVQWVWGERDGREYLEFYAISRFTDDRHHRIWQDGEWEHLEALATGYGYDPQIPGDEERARQEFFARNQRIAQQLSDIGLLRYGTMNTVLQVNPDL